VSTFVDRGVSRGQRGGSPTVVNLSFLDRLTTISLSKWLSTRLTCLPLYDIVSVKQDKLRGF
jgi:hypothetical protein